MPSPFPGMDPFIEGQIWRDFHATLLHSIRRALVPQVRPQYVVQVEEYVYLASDQTSPDRVYAPDLRIYESDKSWEGKAVRPSEGELLLAPLQRQSPMPDEYEQTYLEIRTREGGEIVTVIEILSPTNKGSGPGRIEYLNKRRNIAMTPANLVELDLLRGGARLPTTEPLPDCDYTAFITRKGQFPDMAVFAWRLRDALPRIPIPLLPQDEDVVLDLHATFASLYDEAGYDYSLNYQASVSPPLGAADAQWVAEQLAAKGLA